MLLNDLWGLFEEEFFPFRSTDELFNQYSDNDLRFDLPKGDRIRLSPKVFVWNAVPFHPHKRGEMLSIRHPTREEIYTHSKVLSKMLSLMKPKHIVAVGRKAELALKVLGKSSIYVGTHLKVERGNSQRVSRESLKRF